MRITRANSKHMGDEDKGVGRHMGNGKCMLIRTGKKCKYMSVHIKIDDTQICARLSRAKITKKTKQSHNKDTKQLA